MFAITTVSAIEFGRPLDDLHENEPERKKFLNSLSTETVLALLCSNPEYFYTSSNHMLFDRLKSDLKGKKVSDLLLELGGVSFDSELGRNFLFRAINYDRTYGRDNSMLSKSEASEAVGAILKPLESGSFNPPYYFLLANGLENIISTGSIKRESIYLKIGHRLNETRAGNISGANDNLVRALEYLLVTVSPETTLVSDANKQAILSLKEMTKYNPESYRNKDGFVTAIQVYDKEDTGDYNWSESQRRFSEEMGKPQTGSNGELIYTKGKNRVILYMGQNAEENQSFIRNSLEQYRNLIFTFRGHSYSLEENFPSTIFSSHEGNILFIPGSCGSAGSTAAYIASSPKSNLSFVSNTSTGRGRVTDTILLSLLNTKKKEEFTSILADSSSTIEDFGGDLQTIKFSSQGEMLLRYALAGSAR